jgi:hypothetical protein
MIQTNLILRAIKKDLERRYISVSRLQSDGRLELDKACLNILNPKDEEEFNIIDDNSSIIIVRNPLDIHKDKVISKAIYKEKRGRLQLAQNACRTLLACKIGIKAFRYNQETALEVEPFVDVPNDKFYLNLTNIDELAPYILRSSRSVLHIDVLDRHQKINHSGTTFRILGEYWITNWHQDITDQNFKYIKCPKNDCEYCLDSLTYPLSKQILWYPIIAYEQNHYARPGLLSFHSSTKNTSTTSIHIDLKVDCKEWAKKCGIVEQYFKRGVIDYTGDKIYKIQTNDIGDVEVSQVEDIQINSITQEENGLMRLALKELMDTVNNYKP